MAEDARSCLTAHGKADDLQYLGQTQRAIRIRTGDPGKALGKDAAGTVGYPTEEAPRGEVETDGDPIPR